MCTSCGEFVPAYVVRNAQPVCLHCAGLAPPGWEERQVDESPAAEPQRPLPNVASAKRGNEGGAG